MRSNRPRKAWCASWWLPLERTSTQAMCWLSSSSSGARLWRCLSLLGVPVVLQNIFSVVVFDLGRVPQYLIVCSLEQLLAAIAELRSDRLLHPRILKFTLPSGFLGHNLHNPEAHQALAGRIDHRDHRAVLTRLELHHHFAR